MPVVAKRSRYVMVALKSAPVNPDAFQYEISVPESGRSVVVGEHELPSELDPLRQRLSQGGQAEPPSRQG
jgi:hypothetical protein